MKIFSTNAAGFLPKAEAMSARLAAGVIDGIAMTPAQIKATESALFNARMDVGITAMFMLLVAIIVIGCAREWYLILSGTKKSVLHEGPYIPLAENSVTH
jgi:carbon starvation protein